MSAFVETYGHVKYYKGIHKAKWFPEVTGPCEIPGCVDLETVYRTRELLYRSRCKITEYENGRSDEHPTEWYIALDEHKNTKYVVDHCHKHGYTRGIVCQDCNASLSAVDVDLYSIPRPEPSWWEISEEPRWKHKLGLAEHRNNCSECAKETTLIAATLKKYIPPWKNVPADNDEPRFITVREMET